MNQSLSGYRKIYTKLSLLLALCYAVQAPIQAQALPAAPSSENKAQPVRQTAQADVIKLQIQGIIDNYRRILSLQGYGSHPNRTAQEKQEAHRAGEALFIENQHTISALTNKFIKETQQHNFSSIDGLIAATQAPHVVDADLFAIREMVNQLSQKTQLPPLQEQGIKRILLELEAAHRKYGEELTVSLQQEKLHKSNPARPAWNAFIAQVEQQYPAPELLAKFHSSPPQTDAVGHQGQPPNINDIEAFERKNEWMGLQLQKGEVLLTFDDGPHPTYTPEILAILARYKVKAIFFQLGQNLGTVTDGKAELTRNAEIEKEILAAGHAIGNHSFTHPILTKLSLEQIQQEIDKTQSLLNLIITDDAHRTHMFRAPYGARNSEILIQLGERGLRSVLWNVDSLDWSDPVPESIVHRILQELDNYGRGIILMHDIHAKTVLALPLLLDELNKRGYHFVHWENGVLVPTKSDTTPTTAAPLPATLPIAPAIPLMPMGKKS